MNRLKTAVALVIVWISLATYVLFTGFSQQDKVVVSVPSSDGSSFDFYPGGVELTCAANIEIAERMKDSLSMVKDFLVSNVHSLRIDLTHLCSLLCHAAFVDDFDPGIYAGLGIPCYESGNQSIACFNVAMPSIVIASNGVKSPDPVLLGFYSSLVSQSLRCEGARLISMSVEGGSIEANICISELCLQARLEETNGASADRNLFRSLHSVSLLIPTGD